MSAAGKALKEAYQWEARKVLLDPLTGTVWLNDKQIMRMTVEKAFDKGRPRN